MELFNTISIVRRLEFDTNSEPLKVYQHDTIVKYRFYYSDIMPSSKNKKAWINGNIYSAPFWIGYNNNGNMYRIGYSHQYVQSLTQNAVHKYLVKTPFFLGTDNFYKGMFSYSGYNNPLSLW